MPIAYNNSNNKQKLSVLIPDSANGTDVLGKLGNASLQKVKKFVSGLLRDLDLLLQSNRENAVEIFLQFTWPWKHISWHIYIDSYSMKYILETTELVIIIW